MELREIIWKDRFIDKIEAKHRARTEESNKYCLASLIFGGQAKAMSKEKICTPRMAKRQAVDI